MKNNWVKRLFCGVLTGVLVLGNVPVPTFAVEADGLCKHHTAHTAECGYAAGVTGSPCNHIHTDECYQAVTECIHVHDGCGYVAAVEGHGCDCTPNENGVIAHIKGCGYVEAVAEVPCDHICSEESGCIKKVLSCQHQHNSECGYVEEKVESPCAFACEECAKEVADKEAADAVAALIEALPAVDALQEMTVEQQAEVYAQVQEAYDAYQNLSETQKATMEDRVAAFTILFDFFNGRVATIEASVIDSGKCGDNATWSVYSDKSMVISGSGSVSSKPWQTSYSSIETITVEEGITDLCDSAFRDLPKLLYVSLPTTLSKIPAYCFFGDSGLSAAVITENITSIGEYAYGWCTEIESVIVPDSVTGDISTVFVGCSNLHELKIGKSVSVIKGDTNSFSGITSLEGFEVSEENPYFKSIDGVLYTKDGKTLVICPPGKTGVVNVANGTETINSCAFYNSVKIQEINIPDSVTAFTENEYSTLRTFYAENLKNINVDAGNRVFASVDGILYNKAKTTVLSCGRGKEGNIKLADNLWSIGRYAFLRCGKITSVDIPSSVTDIGFGAFSDCISLQYMVVPADTVEWGQFAFQNCKSMKWIAFGVKNARFYQDFDGCSALTDVYYYGSEDDWNTITISSFDSFIKNATKHINAPHPGEWTLNYELKGGINNSNNPDTYYNYGDALTFEPPTRDGYTFGGWFSDAEYTVEVLNPLNVRGISSGNITLYAKWVGQEHRHVFDENHECECGAVGGSWNYNITWTLDEEAGVLTISGEGCMGPNEVAGASTSDIPWVSYRSSIKKVVIGDEITSIGHYAFDGCDGLSEIQISNSVARIGYNAFRDCTKLKKISIPNSVVSISSGAFSGCTHLETVNIPHELEGIQSETFFGCTSLSSVVIPANINSIEASAFNGCISLKDITFEHTPQDTLSITEGSFRVDTATPTSINVSDDSQINTAIADYRWNLDNRKIVYNGGVKAQHLTLSGLDPNDYLGQMIGRKDWVALYRSPSNAFVDMEYSSNDSSILEIISGDQRGCDVIAHKPGTVTLTATDKRSGVSTAKEVTIIAPKVITEPYQEDILIDRNYVNRYYSFTPEKTGRYIFTTTACEKPGTDSIIIYIADETSDGIASSYVYPEDDICQVVADLTAGVTYQVQPYYAGITLGRVAEFSLNYLGETISTTAIDIPVETITCELIPFGDYSKDYIDANRLPAGSDDPINWESSDSNIVEILDSRDTHCTYLAKKVGTAVITATCNGYTDSVTVQVNSPETIALDQPITVTPNGFDADRIFAFTPDETAEYAIQVAGRPSMDPYLIFVYSQNECSYINGYGADSVNRYATLTMGETYYIWIADDYAAPSYTVCITQNPGRPQELKLRCIDNRFNQLEMAAYFNPANTHEKIVKWEVDNETLLVSSAGDWFTFKEFRNTFKVLGKGEVTITATSESGLTASYTLTVGNCPDGEHTYTSEITAPTCSTNGFTIHTCSVCGDTYLDSFEYALGHDLVHHDSKAASCTVVGWDAYDTCSRCDYSTYKELPANNHTEVIDQAVTATCTTTGLTQGKHCSVCNAVIVKQEVVPAAHQFESGVCKVCGLQEGSCGENLTYTLTSDGVLTITGSGTMQNYVGSSSAPWYSNRGKIVSVILSDGVTSIGAEAFRGCSNLVSVAIPDSVTSIGREAFRGCSKLPLVNIPAGVTTIYENTFNSCIKMTSVSIPEGVIEIKEGAFENCSDLTSIVLPSSVTSIGNSAFSDCCRLTEIIIPSGVTTIGNGAFRACSQLTEIVLPSGIKTIGENTFSSCSRLKSIVIPTGVTSIGNDAFRWCVGLSSVTIPNSVTTIGSDAFDNCLSLTTITMPEKVSYIGESAFYDSALAEIHFLGDGFRGASNIFNSPVVAYYSANNTTWTQDIRDSFGPNVTWRDSSVNYLDLKNSELANQSTVWISGVPYPVQKDSNGASYVNIPDNVPPVLVTYSYNNSSDDRHTQYPTGMQAYRIHQTAAGATVERLPELDNLLQYSGSSIRITGNKGIRMITSVNQNTRNALTGNGLAGFKLLEYGTALCRASVLANGAPLVLETAGVKSNYAYKKDVADPVFKYAGDLIQYTNVLVGFTDEDCKEDIAMRPYIKLEDENGEVFTIYGGIVYRSIGYIAYQNRTAFPVGSAAYEYVWNIIHYVYGTKYDADYQK